MLNPKTYQELRDERKLALIRGDFERAELLLEKIQVMLEEGKVTEAEMLAAQVL